MYFNWFDTKKSQEFGTELAKEFIEKVPLSEHTDEKSFSLKAEKALAKMTIKVAAFKQENSLNIYKKAQLGNAFKWSLKDAGVNSVYIDKLTQWLMLHIS